MYTIQTSPERKLKLCALPTCEGKRYDLVHKFPMNNERAQQWIEAIDMPELREIPLDKVRKRFFICSKHFRPQDYKNCESRSLNTTAYPRLHLKVGIEEKSDENSQSNVAISIDELQVIEYIPSEGGTEMRETIIDPLRPAPTVKKEENPLPVQFIVSSAAANNVPILLRRNQKKQPEDIIEKSPRARTITQTTIPVKSIASQMKTEITANRVVNIIEDKLIPNKYGAKRSAARVLETPCKKTLLDEMEHTQSVYGFGNGLCNQLTYY